MRTIYYFGGSTYFIDVLPFLKLSLPQYDFDEFSHDKVQKGDWVLIIPTVDSSLDFFLNTIYGQFRFIGLLDLNHFEFHDDKIFEKYVPTILLSPKHLSIHTRQKIIPSLHGEMMKTRIKPGPLSSQDYFFCSQPLKEDRPSLGFTQFDLLRALLRRTESTNRKVFIKRHPREKDDLPHDILHHKNAILWEHSIESALETFKYWFGHSSIALFDAQSIGHQVEFMKGGEQ